MRSRSSDSSITGGGGGGNGGNSGNNDGSNGTRHRTCKTPDDVTFERHITNKDYWTHERCAHTSMECRSHANGHKKDATLESRVGGFNAFCE